MPEIRRNVLGQCLRGAFGLTLAVVLVPASGLAQNRPQVSLETSETLFTVLTAINTCGYDQELNSSDPLRAQIRSEVAKAVENTAGAQDVIAPMCGFYRQRQAVDASRDLSQYLSLALYLDEPPAFTPKVKQAELPPDTGGVADMVPLMQAFYQKIGLHAILERHHVRYGELTEVHHAPLAMKNGSSFKRLEPLLDDVKMAPMDEAFKSNISLLVTECLVRAIEERTLPAKTSEAERAQSIEEADKEGYILTRYFYDALGKFEKDPASMRNVYADLLSSIDVGKEMKRASVIQFASEAAPELLHLARPRNEHLLLNAERRLAAGDPETAQKLAQQALDEQEEDSGRALFILAEVATQNRDMEGARTYFERALQNAHEPKVIAWSHIYLGRIFDLKEDRFAAMDQYRAALTAAGAVLPEAKLAAQRGLEH